MNKFIAQIFGMVVFVYVTFHFIGIAYGYMEQQAFIRSRDELIQRIRETDPAELLASASPTGGNLTTKFLYSGNGCSGEITNNMGSELGKYITKFRNTHGVANVNICLELVPGSDKPDEKNQLNTISYGDKVRVGVTANGSGQFGFRRPQSITRNMAAPFQQGKPYYTSVREITIQNRSEIRVRDLTEID